MISIILSVIGVALATYGVIIVPSPYVYKRGRWEKQSSGHAAVYVFIGGLLIAASFFTL